MLLIAIIIGSYFFLKKHGEKILNWVKSTLGDTFGFIGFVEDTEILIKTTYCPDRLREIANALEQVSNTVKYDYQKDRVFELIKVVNTRIENITE